MSTHTITKVGTVNNKCNKQVMYSIILLERELKEVYYQIKSCLEYEMDAFISHFKAEGEYLISQISDLVSHLRFNVDLLTQF